MLKIEDQPGNLKIRKYESNIMNKKHILVMYDKELRIHRMYPEARREVNGTVVRFVREAPGMNFISFTFATERELDCAINQEVNYFAPMHQPLTWKVYEHDLLPDLNGKLNANNFVEDPEPADVMVYDVKAQSVPLRENADIDIRRINTRAGLKDITHVLDTVYGNDNSWVYNRLGSHMQIPGYLSVYAAYRKNQPVSIAWTYFPKGHFATLFAGSTIEEFRGKGLYTNLLATRINEIRERGYQFAVVEAGKMSKPIVEKHGFQHLTTVWDFEWRRN